MKKDKLKNPVDIAIITTEPFPVGMAATNRIISWTKVLSNHNVLVKVYIVKPTEKRKEILNNNIKGVYQKIQFEYLNDTTIWPIDGSKIYKLWIVVAGHFNLITRLTKDRPERIVTYTHIFSIKALLLILRFFLNYKLIIEETEYPKIFKRKHSKISEKLHLALYKYADGMLVMTQELYNYYSSIRAKNIFILPMTVDTTRFGLCQIEKKVRYFAYVGGSGGFLRDGVFDIIKGFRLFSENCPGYELKIIGPIDKSSIVFNNMLGFIKENRMDEKIEFTGSKSTNEIPDLLLRAAGLIMAPPHDFESGGFPTKLGEFLSSGTPVICTKVSDIPIYLNSSNSFLIEPGDFEAMSKAMLEIVNDPIKSFNIGMAGKALANTAFNPETYLSTLMDFFKITNLTLKLSDNLK